MLYQLSYQPTTSYRGYQKREEAAYSFLSSKSAPTSDSNTM